MTLINAAISDQTGSVQIFTEFESAQPRYCGSSLYKDWANPGSRLQPGQAIALSSLLNEKVDFLKLDVEGMESRVLREIDTQISTIGEICTEYHGLHKTNRDNNLEDIVEL